MPRDVSGRTLLALVRHGETALNATHKLRGHSNPPLTDRGLQQAQRTGEALRGMGFDGMLASDLTRAYDTAAIIAKVAGIPLTEASFDLRPWDVGVLAGMDSNKAGPELQRYIEDCPTEPLPGGESFTAFRERYIKKVLRTLDAHRHSSVVIVAHHRNDRALAGWVAAGQRGFAVEPELMAIEGVEPGGVAVYLVEDCQLTPWKTMLSSD